MEKIKKNKKSFGGTSSNTIANDPNITVQNEIDKARICDESFGDGSSSSDLENEFNVLSNYMFDEENYRVDQKIIEKNQKEIKVKMRAILYDWMAEVCNDYMFKRETYYSATKLVDLFMMKAPGIRKNEFQLVGLCGIFIAMKMEEIVTICSDD